MSKPRSERGQAIVLIALALMGIMAFAALAIDASMLFAEYRRAQNVADSAAMSAATAQCSGKDGLAAATKTVAYNGFNTDGKANVAVNTPPKSGPYVGQANYYEVVITTNLKPVFSGFVMPSGGLKATTRAVGSCQPTVASGDTQPGLGSEIAILALNETAEKSFSNTGASKIFVDGGIYINSNANAKNGKAFDQTGSSTLLMNWMQVRGGAQASGIFGINPNGTGSTTRQILVGGDFNSNGSGEGNAGAYFIGGSLTNGASVALKGTTLNVGGSVSNSGAGGIIFTDQIYVKGGIDNSGSGNISSKTIYTGGNVTANGNAPITATGTPGLVIGGNVDLSGSAKVTGNILIPSTSKIKITGGASMAGPINYAVTSFNDVSVNVPVMADPLKKYLNPPAMPTGPCVTLNIQNWGTTDLTSVMVSGTYYCEINVGGSAQVKIPAGTYWVDKFTLGGAATLKMNNVNLYITGKGLKASAAAFDLNGSVQFTSAGTMIYIKNGSFSVQGATSFHWTAPTSGTYKGLALYLDRSNAGSSASQGGSTIASESGTWYAPASACTFGGNTSTVVKSQFICDTVTVHGSSELTIKYDSSLIYQVSTESGTASVSLVE